VHVQKTFSGQPPSVLPAERSQIQLDFPEIRGLWEKTCGELAERGDLLGRRPLFILNGLTIGQEQRIFAPGRWQVFPSFEHKAACFRVFWSAERIFLSTSGLCATTLQREDKTVFDSGGVDHGWSLSANPVSGGLAGNFGNTEVTVVGGGADPDDFGYSSKNSPRPARGMEFEPAPPKPLPDVLRSDCEKKLEFLCALIAASTGHRGTWPVNGLLQVIPLSWARPAAPGEPLPAAGLAKAIRSDLAAIHHAFGLQLPVIAMVTGIGNLTGAGDMLDAVGVYQCRKYEKSFQRRLGCAFPAGQELDSRRAAELVERSLLEFIRLACRSMRKSQVTSDPDGPRRTIEFLTTLCQRQPGLEVLLSHAFERVVSPTVRLHGLYFAATEIDTKEPFVDGVLNRLIKWENSIAWNPRFAEHNRRKSKREVVLTVILGVLTVASLACAAFVISRLW
jgi:hypothetical protein